jgi:cytochrome c553
MKNTRLLTVWVLGLVLAGATAIAAEERGPAGKGAAESWSENCARCHNMRSQSSYSDAEWEVAVMHMRIRGNLTAAEHKKILEFLKASN